MRKPIKVVIEKTLSVEDVIAILSIAFDGGCPNVWVRGRSVIGPVGPRPHRDWWECLRHTGWRIRLTYDDGSRGDLRVKDIDLNKIAAAWAKLYPADEMDPANIDAGDADAILQQAMMGEVVYG